MLPVSVCLRFKARRFVEDVDLVHRQWLRQKRNYFDRVNRITRNVQPAETIQIILLILSYPILR